MLGRKDGRGGVLSGIRLDQDDSFSFAGVSGAESDMMFRSETFETAEEDVSDQDFVICEAGILKSLAQSDSQWTAVYKSQP